MKKILLLIVILGVIAGGFWYFHKESEQNDILTLYGNVEIRQVDISFRVGGVIQDMFFEEGESVKKGDLLASLDSKDYQENLLKSAADVKRQKAILNEADSVLKAYSSLYEQDVATRRTYVSYTNARNEAEAALESAIIANRYQENQLGYTKVYAPDDGIITARIQEPGTTVGVGQLIYTIMKLKPIWIRAYVPETHLGNITYGTKTRVITDTINKRTGRKKEYVGRIGYISPVAEFTPKAVQTEDLRTDLVYRINVFVDEADEFLKQGMPATIKIDLRNKETVNASAELH